jgi:hypothetical protein
VRRNGHGSQSQNFKRRTSSPTPAYAKRCHRTGGRKIRKNFSVGAILQNGAADDE